MLNLKDIAWVGDSKKQVRKFPKEVRDEIGYALFVAQKGDTHPSTKKFKGHGPGIYEIVSNYDTNAYRAIYIVNIGDTIYVLHAFQKKSKRGIKTPKEDLEILNTRLKMLKANHRI